MAKTQYHTAASIDGFIADAANSLDWLFQAETSSGKDAGPVHEQMARAADGRNTWVVGGGELAGRFADAGLLDEILLGAAPVTPGAGAPLLPRRLLASDLALAAVEHDGQCAVLTCQLARQEGSRNE